MKKEDLTKLSNETLLEEQKKVKTMHQINAVLIGVTIGVAIYSTVKNGFGFFTFFPLFFAYLLANSRQKQKEVNDEVNNRKK